MLCCRVLDLSVVFLETLLPRVLLSWQSLHEFLCRWFSQRLQPSKADSSPACARKCWCRRRRVYICSAAGARGCCRHRSPYTCSSEFAEASAAAVLSGVPHVSACKRRCRCAHTLYTRSSPAGADRARCRRSLCTLLTVGAAEAGVAAICRRVQLPLMLAETTVFAPAPHCWC